ncbi:type I restriction endonuclease subunit R [Synechocystis salina LEGE 06155]|nr:type I restriction endonuclease subunit R [Synechocystis salina LEGE 06155]
MSLTSEATFESAIIENLIESGGYSQGNPKDYNPDTGFFQTELIQFLQTTQPKQWEKLHKIHGADLETKLIQRLIKEMELRGSLDVLRNGITDYGVKFRLAYFKPESGLNPDTIKLYQQNRLTVTRQVYFSSKTKQSIDLVLALNGIPVATLELKNQFTGQNTANAKQQYNTTRDPKELLFAFKKRALVHFAVDDEEVYMTTKIDGDRTYWLPFNRGFQNGQGNPPNSENYRTAYLWEDILTKDSWLEIIGKFVHLQTVEYEFEGRTRKKEKLIFPRFHQLDVVRKLTDHARDNGAGQNYLIQHSAGSGKSNSIAWLAYRLSGLHDEQDERIFNSVIVITDRLVLDSQLQETIYQFEHKSGVVQKIDQDSTQLAEAIANSANIIITTLQKFPYVIDKVGELPNRHYAVIIDEAHSSQGGESAKKLKEVLAAKTLEEAVNEEQAFDYSREDDINEAVEKSAAARGQQNNLSFFAFTATPKAKTLAIFGQKDQTGKPKPFHLYSMRQAIEEGFILNVLQNYITYQRFFRLSKAIEDDPELNRKKAAKAIARFVSLHPHDLCQKTEIIIEHFRQSVIHKIGGKAKAMVVTSSRLHAKRYFDSFKQYIKEKGYDKEMKVLVAFSGKVKDSEFPDERYPDGVSEPQLTGFGIKELPQIFEQEEYKILIVADKYQTGFDEPLLHTMYVDKRLSGVKAVQTLSRLNRIAPGKEDTFVLDFVNDRETILESFQPYYELTTLTEEPDPNHLYDLKGKLDQYQIYLTSEINSFAKIYFDPKTKITPKVQGQLYAILELAGDRYKALETEEQQDEFKKSLRTWTNLYAFLAQIMPFQDAELEKFFAYGKLLLTKLPKRSLGEAVRLTDEIALEYYRLDKIKEGAIALESNRVGELTGTYDAGMAKSQEKKAPLSIIIDRLNDRFGTEFEAADRLFFEQIETELVGDEMLKTQAQANKLDTFKFAFEERFLEKLIERMEQNQEIFERVLEDQSFGDLVKELMMKNVYTRLNQDEAD